MIPSLQRLAATMQGALVLAFALALGGAFVPGPVGHLSGVLCVALLIGAPIMRVAWFSVEWARSGDRRFAALGCVLLGILATGAVLAFVR